MSKRESVILPAKREYVPCLNDELISKFHELSRTEASDYIDWYNAVHGTNPVQDIFMSIIFAVIALRSPCDTSTQAT